MDIPKLLSSIDAQIARLQQARALLSGDGINESKIARSVSSLKRRTVSPEVRERIAAGQKRRWAKARKASKKAA